MADNPLYQDARRRAQHTPSNEYGPATQVVGAVAAFIVVVTVGAIPALLVFWFLASLWNG